ncbi:MAG: tetratricopeptide repeat protein [Pseudomonadota bacterium]|nr:tetratricopeptide repeat protein [Pseudomonadota bacterium]
MHPADTFQRALACFQHGDLRQAEALCIGVLRSNRHVDALHVLGLIALQRDDAPKAIAVLRQALAADPRQPVVLLNLGNALLRMGEWQSALASCDAALILRADYAEALNNRGNALLQLHRPLEALASYDRALRSKPALGLFHNNRGNALRDLHRTEEALAAYERALQLQPDLDEALVGRIDMLRMLGRWEQALEASASILARTADHAEMRHLRAKILLDSGSPQAALEEFNLALRDQPQAAAIHLNRGNALFRLGRLEDALDSYRRASELDPNDAESLYNMGNALLQLQRYEDALIRYEAAAALNPRFAKAHYYRGNALRRLKRPASALDAYAAALALEPAYADALSGVGNALRELNRPEEALASYDRALEFDPSCLEALSNRARLLLALNRPEETAACLERMFKTAPETAADYNYALGMLLHSRLLCCDWRDYDATIAAIAAGVDADTRVTLPSLFIAASQSPQAQQRCARLFVKDNWANPKPPLWNGERYGHGKIRLAYVSADFREHPVAQLMAGVFEGHDRERFEVTAITLRAEDPALFGQRIKHAFDKFIDVTTKSDRDAAALLRELEIDIAVDLNGYTDGCRPGIFAQRPAPLQVNYLGYPGTLGAPYMDYLIADATVIPDGDRGFYDESIVHLPHSYQPSDDACLVAEATPTRSDNGLPEGAFVFCCFNTQYKIVPAVFDVWMHLLHAVDGSVLWLSAGRESVVLNLHREALKRGVSPDRLVFAPRLPNLADHLARYRLADLFLDTLPFNAHTTASDALRAGLPVLTCRGRTFAGRVASSLLGAAGLSELITENLAEYEAAALRLARSADLLAAYRERLAQHRSASPLFDTWRFRRNLEAAYTIMWERREGGLPPRHFAVPI